MNEIWAAVRAWLIQSLPHQDIKIWIDPLQPMRVDKRTLHLGCPNQFFLSWIKDKFSKNIQESILHVAREQDLSINNLALEVAPPVKESRPRQEEAHSQYELPHLEVRRRSPLRFNPRFTFDRFVVGETNQLAYYASYAMALGQDINTNSLFLLSDPGLGKSHLSQALGQHVLARNTDQRVYYLTAEDFTNELVYSIKNKCADEFKNKYRQSCDVLVLEEIHFLSGKERVQAELAFTLDYLAENNKKVIFTSSNRPKDIPRLGRHFTSRLNNSLISSIDPPDYPTRLKILQIKAKEIDLVMDRRVYEFMAERLKKDVRQMESCLNSLAAKSRLLKQPIDLKLAEESLVDLVEETNDFTPQTIRDLVCRHYHVSPEDLLSRSRRKNVVLPRNLGMYLCRKMTDLSLEAIGKHFGRNHSTVLYSINLIENRSRKDPKIKGQIEFLTQQLKQFESSSS